MSLSARRAWIEILLPAHAAYWIQSLSARRAWIEIIRAATLGRPSQVALRKESVDRNRRLHILLPLLLVALRKESVDRNKMARRILQALQGRSPQGERG